MRTEPHLGKSCGRLLVLVQKGKRFVSSGKEFTLIFFCMISVHFDGIWLKIVVIGGSGFYTRDKIHNRTNSLKKKGIHY